MSSLKVLIAISPVLGYLCWSDFRRHLLPNLWTVGLLAAALVWRVGYGGWTLMLDGVWAALLAGLFLFLPFLLNAGGGGDVKMLAACGAVVGLKRVPDLLFLTSVSGLLLAVVLVCFHIASARRLKHYFLCLFWWKYDRDAGRATLPSAHSRQNQIPFGIAIASGTWLTLLCQAFWGGVL